MARAELCHTQRQVTVTLDALAEDLHVAGAVHRLQREHLLEIAAGAVVMLDMVVLCIPGRALIHLGDEHVLAELLPVAGALPQVAVDQLGVLTST